MSPIKQNECKGVCVWKPDVTLACFLDVFVHCLYAVLFFN